MVTLPPESAEGEAESIYAFGTAAVWSIFFRNPRHIPEKTRNAQPIRMAICVTCIACAWVSFDDCNGFSGPPSLAKILLEKLTEGAFTEEEHQEIFHKPHPNPALAKPPGGTSTKPAEPEVDRPHTSPEVIMDAG